jgi:hypothetical protein
MVAYFSGSKVRKENHMMVRNQRSYLDTITIAFAMLVILLILIQGW